MICKHLVLSLAALGVLAGTLRAEEKPAFTPMLKIDHKAYIDEALRYALKKHPTMKPENLAFSYIHYQYQTMDPITQVCGPNGCTLVSAAPFEEQLVVCFTRLDTRTISKKADGTYETYETLDVQFPTPRHPEWHLGTGYSTARLSDPEAEKP